MTQEEALGLIDNWKNKLLDPVEMLHLTHLRVIVNSVSKESWDLAVSKASVICSQ